MYISFARVLFARVFIIMNVGAHTRGLQKIQLFLINAIFFGKKMYIDVFLHFFGRKFVKVNFFLYLCIVNRLERTDNCCLLMQNRTVGFFV